MKIHNYLDIEPIEDVPGVLRRVVIGTEQGAPRFIMRVFEVQPGSSTPFHSHWWEHEVFVLSGKGIVKSRESETSISKGSVVFVEPNEEHCFTNRGNEALCFICVIPTASS